MSESDELTAELRALGSTMITVTPSEDLVEQVLARLPAEPPRHRSRGRWLLARRRRLVALIVAVVIIGLGLTSPVRAAVIEWLRIGGVLVSTAPAPSGGPPPTADPVPTSGAAVTLAEAQALVSFPIGVPEDLGTPRRIQVSADRRVVSMDWEVDARPVRLDQFDGELSWIFIKRAAAPFTIVAVIGRDAIWFPDPHEVAYVDADGVERTEQARIAGPCLVWERPTTAGAVTARLEGDVPQKRAIAIADSVT